MVNYYDKHLFISKKKLAELAGVSERTFRRYLATRRHILDEMGISPKSPIYQKLIRELQMTTYFNGEWTRITEIPHDF